MGRACELGKLAPWVLGPAPRSLAAEWPQNGRKWSRHKKSKQTQTQIEKNNRAHDLRLSHKSNVKHELRNHKQHHENGRRMAAQWSQMVAAQKIETKTNTHRKNNRALDTSTEPDPNTFFINSQQGTQHLSFVQKHICPESRLWPRTCSSQCHTTMVSMRCCGFGVGWPVTKALDTLLTCRPLTT